MDSGALSLGRKVLSTAGSHEFWLHFFAGLAGEIDRKTV
jgi:hypothetical protein